MLTIQCENWDIFYQVEVVLEAMGVVLSDVPGAPLAVVVVGAGVDDDDVEANLWQRISVEICA